MRTALRIGLNTKFLQNPHTGSGRYIRGLLGYLATLNQDDSYYLYSDGEPVTTLGSLPRFYSRVLRGPWGSNRPLRKLWLEQVAFPRAAATEGLDLVHYPYFAGPVFPTTKVVITIHDLIPLILPEYRHSPISRLYTALVSRAARKASAIIADSQNTKNDIVRLLRLPGERVRVVGLGVDSFLGPMAHYEAMEALRQRYPLPDNFVLYMGGFDPRKNLGTLLCAMSILKRRGQRVAVVLAGAEKEAISTLGSLAETLGLTDQVIFLGMVPEEDKPALYSAASVFVYPSRYEGFGLPPLEAMACGTPVIASNAASLPEVVGDAGLLVGPLDSEALAEAIGTVLEDQELRARLGELGIERAKGFRWEETARRTLEVYHTCSA